LSSCCVQQVVGITQGQFVGADDNQVCTVTGIVEGRSALLSNQPLRFPLGDTSQLAKKSNSSSGQEQTFGICVGSHFGKPRRGLLSSQTVSVVDGPACVNQRFLARLRSRPLHGGKTGRLAGTTDRLSWSCWPRRAVRFAVAVGSGLTEHVFFAIFPCFGTNILAPLTSVKAD